MPFDTAMIGDTQPKDEIIATLMTEDYLKKRRLGKLIISSEEIILAKWTGFLPAQNQEFINE